METKNNTELSVHDLQKLVVEYKVDAHLYSITREGVLYYSALLHEDGTNYEIAYLIPLHEINRTLFPKMQGIALLEFVVTKY